MIVETTDHAAPRCVVLVGHDALGLAALAKAAAAAGYEVSAVVDRWVELLVAVVEEDPDAVVLELAMAGRSGLRLISALHALAPRCRIVVLSDLRAIDLPALEAGASAVVDSADLRPLTAALQRPANSTSQV
ncbi:response regulator [Nitriliruptor alkaliphilus]|uniref:response regulator n=1 Tax=Nitriliruptor alkaliphilus TaxID=427918 RepID=UPI0006986AB3|nr:response regulator [Nitriliruptor alkaliphilus]